MLRAIFYARFHPSRGPCVLEEYPEGSVAGSHRSTGRRHEASDGRKGEILLDFSTISSYVIPPYDLCDKALGITVAGPSRGGGELRVLGWPVTLEGDWYERNRFTFNVCFVLGEDGHGPGDGRWQWERVVRKTALFFKALEVEDGVLSAQERERRRPADDHGGPPPAVVQALLKKIFEQLLAYNETCIPLPLPTSETVHTLNLRLQRPQPVPKPKKIQAWDVPLLIRPLPDPGQWTWDLTLARIHPFIDGVTHVQRIAERADADVKLAKRAVRGLVACERATVLDLFHFGASYCPTREFGWVVRDEGMLEECRAYVRTGGKGEDGGKTEDGEAGGGGGGDDGPTNQQLLSLYAALSPGQSVHDFVLAHRSPLAGIDVRRFITFGVLKGFLRRVHKYALAVGATPSTSGKFSGSRSNEEASRQFDRAWRKAALSSGWATPPLAAPVGSFEGASTGRHEHEVGGEAQAEELPEDEKLRAFLDGKHCLDEACVAMRLSERKVIERLRSGRFGEVVVFCM